MRTFFRRLLMLLVGIALLVAPTLWRDQFWQYNTRPYLAPEVADLSFAATPIPTPTAAGIDDAFAAVATELRAGPVVVDLAHFNFLNPSSFQPLADALADRGIGLRLWLSTIDPLTVLNYLDYPDQSDALAEQLADASALVVISPYFLWSAQEIQLVEQFVADGGRLLLISDPDIMGDFAAATNMIGEPFGVVFNDDYLYDTTTNDGNYTFFFQEAAADTAPTAAQATREISTALADSTIVFYGGRSLGGDVQAQLRSTESTLSSLRTGSRGFTTAAIGGLAARNTAGRVLALSDFDVLTEPYRTRHDNQRLVAFVADFLSADQRVNRVADFPNYLGRDVRLAFGASSAINADLILQGAQIQQALERSGRTLALTDSSLLTGTVSLDASSTSTATDLIYLADYTTAMSKTLLLTDLGIELFTEVVTETVPIAAAESPAPPPTATSAQPPAAATPETNTEDDAGSDEEEPDQQEDVVPASTLRPEPTVTAGATLTPPATLTTTRPFTATEQLAQAATPTPRPMSPVTATVTATVDSELPPTVPLTTTATLTTTAQFEERVVITTYLRTQSGLTFLAEETVLVVRTTKDDQRLVLAVLAASNRGIDAGVKRLLSNDFEGCVIGDTLTFCSLPPNQGGSGRAPEEPGSTPTPTPSDDGDDESGDPAPGGTATPVAPPRGADAPILLIDDNAAAAEGELSEADIYLQPLIAGGYEVDLWSVTDQGAPPSAELLRYGWVIWSNAGYANGEIDGDDLDTIFAFVGAGGRLTISSRTPLPGLEARAPLLDVVTATDIPALVAGLATEPIAVSGDDTTAAVLSAVPEDDEASSIVLRRGPTSDNADAPLLVVLADSAETTGDARLMVAALSMGWLPQRDSTTLINNMASWMLTE